MDQSPGARVVGAAAAGAGAASGAAMVAAASDTSAVAPSRSCLRWTLGDLDADWAVLAVIGAAAAFLKAGPAIELVLLLAGALPMPVDCLIVVLQWIVIQCMLWGGVMHSQLATIADTGLHTD